MVPGSMNYHSTRLFSSTNTFNANSGHRHVCVLLQDEDHPSHASAVKAIAESLTLPIMTPTEWLANQEDEQFTHILCVEDYLEKALPQEDQYALAIQPTSMIGQSSSSSKKRRKKLSLPKTKPFWIDLCPPVPDKRTGQPDLLLQAVAPQRVEGGAVVMDLTAGWAQDSLLLAQGGASQVKMVERDPIVACLLKDALRRVQCISQSTKTSRWQQRAQQLNGVLSLQLADARQALNNLEGQDNLPDILYLDPMFPPRTKKAAVKKNMQILHGLFETNNRITDDDESDAAALRDAEETELLRLAYKSAQVKVVVKRPINAPTLGGGTMDLKPAHTVKGSINRWDIYVK